MTVSPVVTNGLTQLAEAYIWDGDVMECRRCRRRLHVSKADQDLRHGAECPNAGTGNPWQGLKALLLAVPSTGA